MPKKSQFEDIKPKALALLRKGARVSEVCDRFPQLPLGSVKTWAKKVRDETGSNVRSGFKTEPQNDPRSDASELRSVVCEVVPTAPRVVPLPSQDESDYQLARRVAREVAKDSKQSGYNRIMAVGALAKLIEMRHSLPSAALDGINEKPLKEEIREANKRSPEELAQRFKDLLEQTG